MSISPAKRGRSRTMRSVAAIAFYLAAISVASAEDVPKQVLAFYYGWYGTPAVSGGWQHWKDVDPARRRIAQSKHYPLRGAYDSRDPKVVAEQIDEAKAAGITGFITDFWDQDDHVDKGLPLLLSTARSKNLVVSAIYDRVKSRDLNDKINAAVKDLDYILKRYGQDPAWLKIDGKPVLFVYAAAIMQFSDSEWSLVVNRVRRDVPGGEVLIADSVDRKIIAHFDGSSIYTMAMHTGSMQSSAIRRWAQDWFPKLVALPGPGKVKTVTVIPGYDDTATDPPPRKATDRWNGETYKVLWQEAIKASPDYVLISTWNEWHEGSEIEPSAEYGDEYVKLTKIYSDQFLAGH